MTGGFPQPGDHGCNVIQQCNPEPSAVVSSLLEVLHTYKTTQEFAVCYIFVAHKYSKNIKWKEEQPKLAVRQTYYEPQQFPVNGVPVYCHTYGRHNSREGGMLVWRRVVWGLWINHAESFTQMYYSITSRIFFSPSHPLQGNTAKGGSHTPVAGEV